MAAEIRDDSSLGQDARVDLTLARNLPIVLLCSTGYFVFFSAVWGPLRPWKILVAAGIVLGLALALRVSDPRAEARSARKRRQPGGREAAAKAAWPWWRRAGAVLSGSLLCFAGIYQSLGLEVDLRAYPLISGLCLIVSIALGVTLIARGWPRERWHRKPASKRTRERAQARAQHVPRGRPRTPPAAPVPSTGSAFRMPIAKDTGFTGMWGGVGTRPGRRIWKPGSTSSPPVESGPVPARFRGLRLLRRRRSREAPMPASALLLVVLFAAGFVAALLYWILGG